VTKIPGKIFFTFFAAVLILFLSCRVFSCTAEPRQNGITVAIDAGHQQKADYSKEPIGPGAEEIKARVSSGAEGITTHMPEYKLNLENSEQLKKELESRGYKIVMSRETNGVSLSNRERTEIACLAGADIVLHIHANATGPNQSSDMHGAMTLCITPSNPFHSYLYEKSRRLAGAILDSLTAATGAKKIGVWETDTMSGLNWSTVPAATVEVGYMTYAPEDKLMQTAAYQKKIAAGIADGIDKFFGRR
jgi:N-acetylmuramoyl-L-alanine amidase